MHFCHEELLLSSTVVSLALPWLRVAAARLLSRAVECRGKGRCNGMGHGIAPTHTLEEGERQ